MDVTDVAVVIDHPAQQFSLAFRLLSEQPGIRLKVYYWSVAEILFDKEFDRPVSWDVDLLGGYPWKSPPAKSRMTKRLRWLASQFRSDRPEVVVCYGWASPIARASIAYCQLTRTRCLLYGDTTWQHASSGRRSAFRSLAIRFLMQLSTGAISTGTFNREFYIQHGMHPRRIFPGVCPADTKSFSKGLVDSIGEDSAICESLRIGFAGKLIPRKGADELLRAIALLPNEDDCTVIIVGDGPLMSDLQELSTRLGVDKKVTFHGFANTTEMPKLLASFDVVVVPSRLDMRALITIEAMAAGAAIVISDATAVWGPGDLIEHGVSGLVYPSGNPRALAEELGRLVSDRQFLMKLRRAGRDRVAAYGPEAFAGTTASAIRMCMSDTAGKRRQRREKATTGP